MIESKHRVLSIILTIMLVFSCVPALAYAENAEDTVIAKGTCGDNVTWSLVENGTLTISGSGKMVFETTNTSPWDNIREMVRSVIIEDGVTSIDTFAFLECVNLKNVDMADSVTEIGTGAFYHCSSLDTFAIPDTVTTIKDTIFIECDNLTSVSLPNNLKTIPSGMFVGCDKLESIEIPQSVESIEWDVFLNCSSLKKVDIPKNVSNIGSNAFVGCSSLSEIVFECDLPTIEGNAFKGIDAIAYYPNTWQEVPTKDASGQKLNLIWTPYENEESEQININMFEYVESKGGITITGLKDTSLSEIIIPDTINGLPVIAIDSYAFKNQNSIKTIVVPQSVIEIGVGAFKGTALEEITIPFIGTSKTSSEALSVFGVIFGYTTVRNVYLDKATAKIEDTICQYYYTGSNTYSAYHYYIPETLSKVTVTNANEIPYKAFYGCSMLEDIDINDETSTFGAYAFYGCESLTEVKVPNGVDVIPSDAFSECSKLKTIILPSDLSVINSNAFYKCVSLTDISLPTGLTSIGRLAFYGCTNVDAITLPNSIKIIDDSAFSNCDLSSIYLPNGLETIGNGAFSGNKRITSVVIPNSVNYIGASSFNGTSLTEITLPFIGESETTSVDKAVFGIIFGRTTVRNVYLDKATAKVADATCQYFESGSSMCVGYHYYIPITLKKVTITNDKAIPQNAFYGCDMIQEINIDCNIASIEDNAFYNCNSIEKIYLPDSLVEIGANVFEKCDSLLIYANKDTVGYIYAKDKGINRSSTASIELNKNKITLFQNDEDVLKATVTMLNGKINDDPDISWTTSNSKIITVAGGIVSVVGPGTAVITASCEGVSTSCIVNVYYLLKNISFKDNEKIVELGSNEVLTILYSPSNTTDDKSIAWKSSNENIVTVDDEGYVKGVAEGVASITATTKNGLSAECEITVGHYWDDKYTIDKEATCTFEGSKSIHCTKCDKTKDSIVIDKKQHDYSDWIINNEATCVHDGNKYKECLMCGEVINEAIMSLGHVWDADYTIDNEPTCILEGTKSIHCANCDEVKAVTAIDKTAHSYGKWLIDKKATCISDGVKHKECSVCGNIVRETIISEGHEWDEEYTIDIEATCNEEGKKSIHCNNCDEIKDVTVIDKTEHVYGDWIIDTDSTCTKNGLKHKICASCKEIVEEEIIAEGHNIVVDKAIAATSTKYGLTEGSHCSKCNIVFEKQNIIPAVQTEILTLEKYANEKEQLNKLVNIGKIIVMEEINDKILSLNNDILKYQLTIYNKIDELEYTYFDLSKVSDAYIEDRINQYATEIAKLNDEIFTLSLDDSRIAKAQKAQKEAELAELIQEQSRFMQDVTIKKTIESLLEQCDLYQAIVEKQINEYQKIFDDDNKITELAYEVIEKSTNDEFYNRSQVCLQYFTMSKIKQIYESGIKALNKYSNSVKDALVYLDNKINNHEADGHVWSEATCTEAKKCYVCGAVEGEATGHIYGGYKTSTKAKFSRNGEQIATCTVCKDIITKSISAPKTIQLSTTSYTYNGKTKSPTVKAVYDSNGHKISSSNYTVSYASGRKSVGKYKVTVNFKSGSSNYTGSSYTTFKINPKGTSISKLSKGKKAFTVKWKKQSGKMSTSRISGYQYRYSTSSKMTKAITKTVKGYSKTSAKKTGLKVKKKYYVQVRTYKTVNGTKYYSSWSKAKSVTTK